MFTSINKLPNAIPKSDGPNPKAAQALQEGLGGTIRRNENYDAVLVSEYKF